MTAWQGASIASKKVHPLDIFNIPPTFKFKRNSTMASRGYDDGNRAFLQALMARSTLTFEESQPLLASILSARGTLLALHITRTY